MRPGRRELLQVWIPLAAYAALIAVLALTHDMWRDEVRAFSVATRATSWGRMIADLSEEGHPVVWYAILRAGYALSHSALVLPVAAGIIAIAAAWIVLRFAPFPLWARLLAVFGAFLGHELSVLARNYGIGVLFMLAAAASFSRRAERPWLLALWLVLLANTSVHGALASALLLFLWLLDAFDSGRRAEWHRASQIASGVMVLAGIGVALASAHAPPEMAYSFSLSDLDMSSVARAIFVDPARGLVGYNGDNIMASAEIPWILLGLDRLVVSRLLVNIALAFIAWALLPNRRVLIVFILSIAAFEILFRVVYTGGLRHEAVLTFLLISLCWIAIQETASSGRDAARRRITLGLLPLLAVQALALPFMARRHIMRPESMAPQLAAAIDRTPRFDNAVLMSEPDPLMETMAYYADNPVYMARQREFDYRTYFDKGRRRQRTLTLSGLVSIADSVGCATGRPVLISLGYRRFFFDPAGQATGPYESQFTWTQPERQKFQSRVRPLPFFRGAMSDENYRTYELIADCGSRTFRPQD